MLNYPVQPEKLFSITQDTYLAAALEIFRFQYLHNRVFNNYVNRLGVAAEKVDSLQDIPFLPISFFKTQDIITEGSPAETVFTSSGTSGSITSRHPVADLTLYNHSVLRGFTKVYGPPEEWIFFFLLPSYLERSGSSLVYMAEQLIMASGNPLSGFFLYNHVELAKQIIAAQSTGKKVLLMGVTFALLDFAEKFRLQLSGTVIMETGGMKGRREEMVREEVHARLQQAFSISEIHSEYGMTEMLSQAYSKGGGIFHCPPWLKVLSSDLYDPLDTRLTGKGRLKVIDLANIFSCSFIATDDVGEVFSNGSFVVTGRSDGSDTRGCNLMVASL